VENAKLNTRAHTEKLRSLITDDIVAVGQKYKATTLDINYANFILVLFFLSFYLSLCVCVCVCQVSNNDVPVRLGVNDRHYLATRVSSRKIQDLAYFAQLDQQTSSSQFYQSLTRFFKTYDLSNYKPYDGLMNSVKRMLILASADPLDNFIIANYPKLCDGMSSDKIVPLIHRFGFPTKDGFWKRLNTVCDQSRPTGYTRIYTLKDWAVRKYMAIATASENEHL
jgi:hypothetical protein